MVNFLLEYKTFFTVVGIILGLFLMSLVIIIPIAMESLLSVHSSKKGER